jgi:Xaa-Pro aminopeptidase
MTATATRRVPEPTYPTFGREEIAARVGRICEGLAEIGVELLLLTGRENVVYFSGISSSAWVQKGVVPAVLLIDVHEASTTMLLPDFWLGTAEKTTWIDDFGLHRNSHSQPDDFARFVAEAIARRRPRRIGYEAGYEMLLGMPLRQYERLRASLGGDVAWVDAGPAIWEARMIKSPAEIERLRRSAQATGRAQERLRDHARPGMNELELGYFLRRELLQPDGGEQDRIFLNMRAGAARYSMTDTFPKNRVVEEGDVMICDAGIFLEGYASDTARTISIGEPSARHASVYEHVVEARRSALELVRAGTPASALYDAVRKVYDDAGLPVHIDMVGHGIGLDLHEPPMLAPGNDVPLRENMVLCIEPWVTLPYDEGVLTIEDTFLVTRDGYEQLTLPNADELWRTSTNPLKEG